MITTSNTYSIFYENSSNMFMKICIHEGVCSWGWFVFISSNTFMRVSAMQLKHCMQFSSKNFRLLYSIKYLLRNCGRFGDSWPSTKNSIRQTCFHFICLMQMLLWALIKTIFKTNFDCLLILGKNVANTKINILGMLTISEHTYIGEQINMAN